MANDKTKFELARKKNVNRKSTGYNKYYLVKAKAQTLSQRGFINHMTEHGLSIPRSIIESVFVQMTQCIPELCATGVGVRIDGLGIFYPSVKSTGKFEEAECIPAKCLQGVRVRFKPDSSKLDDITSKTFAKKVEPEVVGYVDHVVQPNGTKKKIVIPYGAQLTPEEP